MARQEQGFPEVVFGLEFYHARSSSIKFLGNLMEKDIYEYSHDDVKKNIIRHGAGLGLPRGWLEQVAEIAASAVDKWVESKSTVTEEDIRNQVINQLRPLNADVAYAYENYDKII